MSERCREGESRESCRESWARNEGFREAAGRRDKGKDRRRDSEVRSLQNSHARATCSRTLTLGLLLSPDMQGFGRRKMIMSPECVRCSSLSTSPLHSMPLSFFTSLFRVFGNCMLAQAGALLVFCKKHGLDNLSHWKPHGEAFLMSAKDIELSRASAACAKLLGIPMVGLPDSAHEQAAKEAEVEFIPGASSRDGQIESIPC